MTTLLSDFGLSAQEEQDLHQFLQRLVRYALWMTIGGTVFQLLPGVSLAPLLFNTALLLFLLAIYLLLARGHYIGSAIGFLAVFWLYTLLAMIFFGGLTNPIIGTQVVLILAAGTLLRRRGLLFFTLWSTAFTVLVLWLDALGYLPPPLSEITPVRALIIHTSNLVGAGLILYYWLQLNQKHQRSLQAQELALDSILNSLPDTLFLLDENGLVEKVYTAHKELLPPALRAPSGQPYHSLLPPPLSARVGQIIRASLHGGAPQRLEYQLNTPIGPRWFEARINPVTKEGKTYLLWIARDITASRQTQTALKKSQELLATAINGARLGVWDWNLAEQKMHLNAIAAEILGQTTTTLPTEASFWRSLIPPEDYAHTTAQMNRHLEGELSGFSSEHRIRTPDGTIRWVLSRARISERDAEGNPRRVTGIFLDITRLKETEAELHALSTQLEQRVQERTAQLEASLHEMEAFTYTISHDLRAPLRGIHGYARILLDDYVASLPDEAQDLLQRTAQNARQMGAMIDQLLLYTRLGRTPLHKTQIDTNQLVAEVWRSLNPSPHVRLQCDPLPPSHGDPHLLRQVWQNLLDNALKYSREAPQPHIHISAEETETAIRFRIADNGIGFDMEYADKIFGVFERLHAPQHYPGTGIGLATCRRIVQRHGGRIWAESQPGQGSVFLFTLPKTHMV